MANWLDKYEQGGLVLKQKTKDNYGVKPNVNDDKATYPDGFVGWEYDITGRNYSPAWGGQFQDGGNLRPTMAGAPQPVSMAQLGDNVKPIPMQLAMGGSMPGAVGFMYARTQSPAPSNGPYAKKTKASAQNGQEMKYYQAGLDFKPKTISQDGLKLIPRATGDLQGPKIDPRMSSNIAAAQEKDRQAQVRAKQEFVGPAAPRTKEHEAYRKRKLAEIAATNPEVRLNDRGELETSPYGDFMKSYGKNLDKFATSLETPLAIMDVAMAGPLVGKFAKEILPPVASIAQRNIAQSMKSGLLSAKNLKEASRYVLQGIPTEKSLPRLLPEELKAFRQVQEIGRLKATGARSAEQMKYALENNLPEKHFQQVFSRSKKEAEDLLASGFGKQEAQIAQTAEESLNRETMQAVEDFYNTPVTPELQAQRDRLRARLRALSNRPAETSGYGTINTQGTVDRDAMLIEAADRSRNITSQLEEFRRTLPEEEFRGRILIPGQERPSMSLLETLNDDWVRYVDRKQPTSQIVKSGLKNILNKYAQDYPYHSGKVMQKVPHLYLDDQVSLKNVSKKVEFAPEGIQSGDVFTGSLNTSHSSYLPQLKQVFKYRKGEPQFLGYKPMNEQGFLSSYDYTNEDIAKYLNSEIDEQIKRGIIPKNIQRPFLKKSIGSDRVILPQYGVRQYQKGGQIPVDSDGYWNPENWGNPVIIPSTDITMEGVYEPLIGISDTGDVQYMEPGEDYEFDGEYVTEYPVARGGVSVNDADAQPIEKLDQLLNFTNYNKPTKGGWLDKYQ